MSRNRILSVILSVAMIISVLFCAPVYIRAVAYDSSEISQMTAFLNYTDENAVKNVDKLMWDINDCSTWDNIVFDRTSGKMIEINIRNINLVGMLDVSGFTELQILRIVDTGITEVNIQNCTALKVFESYYNPLSVFGLLNNPLLEEFSIYRSELNGDFLLENVPAMQRISILDNKFTSLTMNLLNDSTPYTISLNAQGNGGYVGIEYGTYFDESLQSNVFVSKAYANADRFVGLEGWYSTADEFLSSECCYPFRQLTNTELVAKFGDFNPDATELAALKAFWSEVDSEFTGESNASQLGIDIDDYTTWKFNGEPLVYWTPTGKVSEIVLPDNDAYNICGNADFHGFTELRRFFCWNNMVSAVDVSNCDKLISLDLGNNAVSSLNYANCPSLSEVYLVNIPLSGRFVHLESSLSNFRIEDSCLSSVDINTYAYDENTDTRVTRNLTVLSDDNSFIKKMVIGSDWDEVNQVDVNACYAVGEGADGYSFDYWTDDSDQQYTDSKLQLQELLLESDVTATIHSRTSVHSQQEIDAITDYLSIVDENGLSNAQKYEMVADDESTWGNRVIWSGDYVKELDFSSDSYDDYWSPKGTLDVSGFAHLETLWVGETSISSLIVDDCTALKWLEMWGTDYLSNLSLVNCNALEGINIGQTGLNELHLSNLPSLRYLNISYSQIALLTLQNLPNISTMHFEGVKLSGDLDFSEYELTDFRLTESSVKSVTLNMNLNGVKRNVFIDSDDSTYIEDVVLGTVWDNSIMQDVEAYYAIARGNDGVIGVDDYDVNFWSVNNSEARVDNPKIELLSYYNAGDISLLANGSLTVKNQNEIDRISAFLELEDSNGVSNADKIGVSANDAETWDGIISWSKSHIYTVEIPCVDPESCITGELDLSGFTGLSSLALFFGTLTSLDLSNCTNLEIITIQGFSNLTSLNISGCSNITSMFFEETAFETLDVSQCTRLQDLFITNSAVETLTLGNHPDLYSLVVENTKLTGDLDFSGAAPVCIKLTGLRADSVKAKYWYFDTERLITLESTPNASIDSFVLDEYWDDQQGMSIYDYYVIGSGNDGTYGVDDYMFKSWHDEITELDYNTAKLDVKDMLDTGDINLLVDAELTERVETETAAISSFLLQADSLGVSNATKLNVSENDSTTWDGFVTWNKDKILNFLITPEYSGISEENQGVIGSLDVSGFVALENIEICDTSLTSLVADNCPNLLSIECRNDQLTTLSFTYCPKLTHVNCSNNSLTSLDFTGSDLIDSLVCRDNDISSIDFSSLELFNVDLCHNKLSSVMLTMRDPMQEGVSYPIEITAADENTYVALSVEGDSYNPVAFAYSEPKTGYKFEGWYSNSELTDRLEYSMVQPLILGTEIEIYAHSQPAVCAQINDTIICNFVGITTQQLADEINACGLCDINSFIDFQERNGDAYLGVVKTGLGVIEHNEYFEYFRKFVLLGDTNCDGLVNSQDFSQIVNRIVGNRDLAFEDLDDCNTAGDLNRDKVLDARDAMLSELIASGHDVTLGF